VVYSRFEQKGRLPRLRAQGLRGRVRVNVDIPGMGGELRVNVSYVRKEAHPGSGPTV